ncbi:hypothetical protein PUN28_017932 [Cardiocondyla obscurior]|uniref:Uncharacterized protein n=1 Tax=Cardiocondyla obscurior TaxID=286306 RepID=A0AAW2ELU3_9HYME
MCVRNVDVHVSCSSQVDAQLAAFFIDPRANTLYQGIDNNVRLLRFGPSISLAARPSTRGPPPLLRGLRHNNGERGRRRLSARCENQEVASLARAGAELFEKPSGIGYHRYAAHSRAPQRVRIAEIEAAREPRHRWRRVSAHAVVASHKLFSPLDLAILLERSVASRDGRSDEEWEGGADSEDAITSKGITDLLLLNLVRLEAACPSKKICLYVGSKNPPAEAGGLRDTISCPPSHRRNFGGSLAGIVYDLPSNGSSLKDLKCTHSDYGASDDRFSGSSPESNPDSPLPVTTMVGAEPTIDRRAVRVSCVVNAAGTFRAVRATYEPFGLSTPTRGNAVSYSTEPGGRAVGDARSNARRYMGETCEISTPRGLSRCVVRSYLRAKSSSLVLLSAMRTTLLYAPQCFVELGYTYAVTLRYDQT